jgi:hypothetical protein
LPRCGLTRSTTCTLTDAGPDTDERDSILNHTGAARAAAAAQYIEEFERLRSGTFGDLHERVNSRPRELNPGKGHDLGHPW